MDMVKCVVVAFFMLGCVGSSVSVDTFTPADNYLLACGSSQNVTYLGRTYVPDSAQSSVSLKGRGDSYVATSNSTAPFPIYQSARVLRSTTSYRFNIQREGRNWVRLHFYPIPDQSLSSASISVVTENFVLLITSVSTLSRALTSSRSL